ncbi:DUF6207 family protein [Streptomyces tauricus]|uniref:DUF6207 family protein n=1 Tax=Streptomyces tauricus TaxID=68274 RepID=UPI002244B655|nr:DUF6207 family protein [Streptomyces tauricus]MCW8101731.1 DUF6207 family protein [Streptomyces tauricus]
MDPIQETHLSEPGFLVLDVVGQDDATVDAFQSAIARTRAATVDRPTREPGRPGVRLRMYIDLRQPLTATRPSRRWTPPCRRPGPPPRGGERRTRPEAHRLTTIFDSSAARGKSSHQGRTSPPSWVYSPAPPGIVVRAVGR